MFKQILSLGFIGIILILPIQNVDAYSLFGYQIDIPYEDKIQEEWNSLQNFNLDFAYINEKLRISEKLTEKEISDLENILNEIKINHEQFLEWENNSEAMNSLKLYIQAEKQNKLKIIQENPEEATLELTNQLYDLSHSAFQMRMAYAEIDDVKEDVAINTMEEFLGSIYTRDVKTGEPISVSEYMKRTLNDIPVLKNSGIADAPFESILELYVKEGHIFTIPLIPISENHTISIEEYCVRNVDELKCDRMIALGTLAQMIIQKDPETAINAIRIALLVANDINNETNAGLDSELEYMIFLSNFNTQEIINLKIIELDDGNYVSLNEISKIKCQDEIPLLEKIIEHNDKDNINMELLDEDFQLLVQNMDEIKNNQCSLMIVSEK